MEVNFNIVVGLREVMAVYRILNQSSWGAHSARITTS